MYSTIGWMSFLVQRDTFQFREVSLECRTLAIHHTCLCNSCSFGWIYFNGVGFKQLARTVHIWLMVKGTYHGEQFFLKRRLVFEEKHWTTLGMTDIRTLSAKRSYALPSPSLHCTAWAYVSRASEQHRCTICLSSSVDLRNLVFSWRVFQLGCWL